MNRLNYAQRSNFIAGTSEVFKYEFYIQEFNLPSLTINSIESFSQGMKHILTGDSVTHSELDLTVMIDEDFLVYQAFKDWMEKSVDQKSGSFANREFTFYCDVHNSKGNYLFTVMFYGCKIQTMSDVQLSTTDDTFTNTMTISVDYDWFEFKRSGLPDEWKKDFKIITINDETESESEESEEEEDPDLIIKDCELNGEKVPVTECCCAACECDCEDENERDL